MPIKNKKQSFKTIKVLSWNANGLYKKVHELRALIDDEKPDIVAVCEIKMNEITANLLFKVCGYYPYYRLRNENDGGTALFIQDQFISEEIKTPSE